MPSKNEFAEKAFPNAPPQKKQIHPIRVMHLEK